MPTDQLKWQIINQTGGYSSCFFMYFHKKGEIYIEN